MKKYDMDDIMIVLQKMVFIYNALLNGWMVEMIGKDKFEFKRKTTREIGLEDYLRKFVEYNLNIENIMN